MLLVLTRYYFLKLYKVYKSLTEEKYILCSWHVKKIMYKWFSFEIHINIFLAYNYF